MRYCLLFSIFLGFSFTLPIEAQLDPWVSQKGEVKFESSAPLEIIKAQSKTLRGAIDPNKGSFLFIIQINSFEGFNSDVQQIHFMEDYLEWKKYPEARFEGKIIEEIDFTQPGTYSVRAKGNLTIHGVTKERIIKGTLTVTKTGGSVNSQFTVLVDDHGIVIPKIVQQKIADEIMVTVNLDFVSKPKS